MSPTGQQHFRAERTHVLCLHPSLLTDPHLLSEEIFQALTTLVNVLAIVHVEK